MPEGNRLSLFQGIFNDAFKVKECNQKDDRKKQPSLKVDGSSALLRCSELRLSHSWVVFPRPPEYPSPDYKEWIVLELEVCEHKYTCRCAHIHSLSFLIFSVLLSFNKCMFFTLFSSPQHDKHDSGFVHQAKQSSVLHLTSITPLQ